MEVNNQNDIAGNIWAMLDAGNSETSAVLPENQTNAMEQKANNISPDLATEILGRLEQKKETAAAHLGISKAEVESVPFDLTALEESGIFLNIDATGFSVLSRQLDWQSLGIELPKEKAVYLSPPRTGLLPDNYRNRYSVRHHKRTTRSTATVFASRSAKPCLAQANIAGFRSRRLKRLKRNLPPRSKILLAPKPQSSKITRRFSKLCVKLFGCWQKIPPRD